MSTIIPELPPDAVARRLAAIVDSSDDAIISKNLDGIITTWNRAAERMFAFTADEAVGKSITLIIPADRLSEETEVLSKIRRGELVDHFETVRRRKDGSLIPISLTISPIRDGSGRIVGASKIARDISDRKRAEAALAEAEARRLDLQHRLFALVATSGTLFGSPRLDDVLPSVLVLAQSLLPADAYALWRFDDATSVWRIASSVGLSEAFREQMIASYQGLAANVVPSMEPIVAERVRDVPMLEERTTAYQREGIESILSVPLAIGGRATGTLVFYYRKTHHFDDVETQTARALANLAAAAVMTAELYDEQRRMRETAERANRQAAFLAQASATLGGSLDYEATLRAVAGLAVPQIADWCAVDIVDEQGDIQRLAVAHVDPARVALARSFQLGFPERPDTRGGRLEVIRSGKAVLVRQVTDEMLVSSARTEEHLRALRELNLCSYVAVPLAAHGHTFGALTFVSAESGRHYNDDDLRFAQDVGYRAAIAVENARAYREANAANRAKDEFLATLSHELRTPLNAVLGWARMLRSGSVSAAKMPKAFDVIERNALAQLDLVEDLLDMSRIITGKFRLDVAPVDVQAAIEAAVEAIQPAATAKGIAVTIDAEDIGSTVIGDSARLQQVVWNLLANAMKFTPPGGFVHVTLARRHRQVEIEVADTGEGIEPSVLPFVFDRFRQGDSGPARLHSGLGLGLAIVRHIIELHGGRVEATSEGKGRGSKFRLILPALQADDGAEPPTVVMGTPRPPALALAGIRAIVVDDDNDARELLTEVLRSRGVQVTAAASAAECLTALDREVPDILLSDLAMPEQDGFELLQRIRERSRERGGHVPAVALTAYARSEDRERSLSSGFQVHLAKPIDTEKLVSTVARLAQRSGDRVI